MTTSKHALGCEAVVDAAAIGGSADPDRRASRRTRVRGRSALICARDIDILLALAKMRLLRTSDIARLFFSAGGTCQKRLRRLFDAGFVRTVLTGLAAENRYALTPSGHAVLAEALTTDAPPFRAAPRVDRRNTLHLDLLNAYRISLALGVRREGLELRAFVPEWDLRATEVRATLIPDALVVVAADANATPLVLALEVDTGSEAVGVVLRKIEKYRERQAVGEKLFGLTIGAIIILVPKERRAETLARHIVEAGLGTGRPALLLTTEGSSSIDGGLTGGLALPKDLLPSAGKAGGYVRRLVATS